MKREFKRSRIVSVSGAALLFVALTLLAGSEARAQNTLFPTVRQGNPPTFIMMNSSYVELFGPIPSRTLLPGFPQPVPATRYGYPDQRIWFRQGYNQGYGADVYIRNPATLDPSGVYFNPNRF
jgi:hypothetical protein